MNELSSTALVLTVLGALLAVSAFSSRASGRVGVPVLLLFLAIGMLAGSEGLGGIEFEDYRLAFRVGTAALVLILFDGGLNTPVSVLRRQLAPAAVLATAGVVAVAGLVAVAARVLGLPWPAALLAGAIVASTDASAVFSVLRGSGVGLHRRVAATLELESGLNDPVAVLLTVTLTENLVHPGSALRWQLPLELLGELAVGAGLGLVAGLGGRLALRRLRLPASGLYPVATLAIALLAFGVPSLLSGSGFLAVYVAGVVLGNGALPFRAGLLRVNDALAWLAQIAMFLLLGLLVFPSRLLVVAWEGLALALFLACLARPLAAAVCLLPFRYSRAETLFVGWVGLRGAIPIILAIFPVLAEAPGAPRLFDLVFFVVVAGAVVPGATVATATRRFGLELPESPPPKAVLEIQSAEILRQEVRSYYVDEALAVCGAEIAELPLPGDAAVVVVIRGRDLLAPRPDMRLRPGDHAVVLARSRDLPVVGLMFGRAEEA